MAAIAQAAVARVAVLCGIATAAAGCQRAQVSQHFGLSRHCELHYSFLCKLKSGVVVMTLSKCSFLILSLSLAGATAVQAQTGYGWGGAQGWGPVQQMPPGPGYGPQGGYGAQPWGPGAQAPMMGGPGYMSQGWGFAQPWGGPQGPMAGAPGWRDPNGPGRGRYAMVDANEDGTITAEEAASHADMVFTGMDADDDGMLTETEYMAVRMGNASGLNADREAAMQALKAARFDPMDADEDGSVSRAEFMDHAQSHFDEAGSGNDGRVTPWSYRRRNWN
jgi:hypothetical protein